MYYNKDYKMIYWIFDMDETLYQINGSLINYDEIKPNQELVALIKKLSGLKILFTNAGHHHTNIILNKLGLVSSFDLILDRDILGGLKPSPIVFLKLIKWCSISPTDTCYFFEDSFQNLVVGSSLGWKTILIDKNNKFKINNKINSSFDLEFTNNNSIKKKMIINYGFQNITDALKYLTK
jgi:FMN phosphatase YigB (HAD superfamily)